jgi:hypothetical protein
VRVIVVMAIDAKRGRTLRTKDARVFCMLGDVFGLS